MNIQSEIDFFIELAQIDKARFLCRIALEVAAEAKLGGTEANDPLRLRFINEINQRLIRFAYQILSEDPNRPADDIVMRMLLGARTDKRAERIVHSAYGRVLHAFESFDTTVLLNNS
jgi:exoribonuclease II